MPLVYKVHASVKNTVKPRKVVSAYFITSLSVSCHGKMSTPQNRQSLMIIFVGFISIIPIVGE